MKNAALFRTGVFAVLALVLTGCKDTWLMYDTSQKDHLYFEITSTLPQVSFALTSEEELTVPVKVKMMGMPVDYDRTFSIEYVEAEAGETITVGATVMPVVSARPGTDFELPALTMPAGAVEVSIPMIVHREEVMQDNEVAVRFRLVENDRFLPLPSDSTNLKKIQSPLYNLYVNDSEPACPDWWDASTASYQLFGWSMYVGTFYPHKYLKMLELFHEIETKNPTIYENFVRLYGENLDKEGIAKSFFATSNQATWASYVLIPLYNYYVEYYARLLEENPDAEVEVMTNGSGSSGHYWKDPISLLR